MQLTKLKALVVLCFVTLPGIAFYGLPNERKTIELTTHDLFSSQSWDSNDIQVLGIRLGQPRVEAENLVVAAGYKLIEQPLGYSWAPCRNAKRCFLSAGPNYLGLELYFDSGQRVIRMEIIVDPDIKVPITRSFKGRFRAFCTNSYSDSLRLKLLGKETKKESFDGRYGDLAFDTRYYYPNRGVILTVSVRNPRLPSSANSNHVVNTFAFVAPTGH